MMDKYSITPPAELVRQWGQFQGDTEPSQLWQRIATEAAQWGADQELEACCEWLEEDSRLGKQLRAARRPKPPSLKEQALLQLDTLNADLAMHGRGCDLSQIRRALESLPE
jgi:gamma-glutamyl:cysteine ligase YbdK (ATP-grasp superfamily)